MDKSDNYQQLGAILVKKLRDENYSNYLELKNYASSISIYEYDAQDKNPNYFIDLQKNDDERFKFLNGLTDEQKTVLDKLILNILDDTAFNFLREVEENLNGNESISMSINGVQVESLSPELESGTFFGEYFMWLEDYSEYGPYQH